MSKILKAISLDAQGRAIMPNPSKQIVDPFSSISQYGQQLRTPPLNMEQLVSLAEANPMHAACLEQKVSDIVAGGLQLAPDDEKQKEDAEQDKSILMWWESLFEEYTSLEVLQAVWNDYETLGWGLLEVARDATGKVGALYHIPGHTVRAHVSNQLFAQMRNGKIVYFKRWGLEGDFYVNSGHHAPLNTNPDSLANEILVFRKPARRSTWYGIPVYVSGIGHIALAIAARDFNIKFFENFREPRHLIIISGLTEDVEAASDDIETIWTEQLRDNPHHNVLIPIQGEAKVEITKMGLPMNDMHFARLMEQADGEILVAHRMPPDRLGISKRGFLGGSVAKIVNAIYKDGVVGTGQNILESRLTRFVKIEYEKTYGVKAEYHVDFEELDITDEQLDITNAAVLAKTDLLTLNEVRKRLGEDRHEPFEDMTLSEFLTSIGASPAAMAAAVDTSGFAPSQMQMNEEIMRRLGDFDTLVEDLLSENPSAHEAKGHAE